MKMKQFFCILLTLCMVLSMAPMTVLASESDEIVLDLDIRLEDLQVSHDAPTLDAPEDSIWIEDDEYECFEDAYESLKSDMTQRFDETVIWCYFAYSSEAALEDEAVMVAQDLLAYATMHTDDLSTNGSDYLYWNLADVAGEVSILADDTYAYLTIHYEFLFLTDKQQEDAFDSAYRALRNEVDMGGYGDVQGIRAFYEYIAENVDVMGLDEVSELADHSAYAVLVKGAASPLGCALATFFSANYSGLDCRIIPGYLNGKEHFWNIVEVDGVYYNVDTSRATNAADHSCLLIGSDNFVGYERLADYDSAEFHAYYPMAKEDYQICDHVYDEGVVQEAPTCIYEGVLAQTCTICGHVKTSMIPVVDHNYEHVITAEPTCETVGFYQHTCTVCGDSYQEQIPELGHSYETVTVEPTCTEDGSITHTCANCGDVKVEVIAAAGHNWDEGVVTAAPTCTEEGVKTFTCTVCGETMEESVAATGHTKDEGTVAKEPTCTEPGEMNHTCTVCGEAFAAEIAVLPHDYVEGFCSVCGKRQMTVPTIKSCYSTVQDSVKVTWTVSEGATGYQIYRTTDPVNGTWKCIKTINNGNTDRYTNQGLEIGTTYYYKVRAFHEDAEGNRTYTDFSEVNYMPAAVVFDGPYSNSTSRIRILWNEVSGAHGYQIWGQKADGSWKIVKTIGDRGNVLTENKGGTTAYSNTGLVAGDTYTYKMRAFMITENGKKVYGAYSDVYSVAVKPETPAVTVTCPKAGRAQISWEPVNGAAGYQIWMEQPNGEYKIIKTITDGSTSYTKTGLTTNFYFFKVRAYSEAQGRKAFSAFSPVYVVDVL